MNKSRIEDQLARLAGDNVTPDAPKSRVEMHLARLAGDSVENIPAPQSRIEMLLQRIYDNGGLGDGDTMLGEKLYAFGVLSDIHLRADNYRHGIDDFNRAIPCLQDLGADFVCIAGDIGYDGVASELQLYKTAIDTHATVPFYACNGNHDVNQTEADWQQYIGHPLCHEFVHNGDVFMFLSLETALASGDIDKPYGTNITWLKNRIERYKGARIFLFMHFPPSGYSGLADGQFYGFSSTSTEDDELMAVIMQTKNITVFTGHTHFAFDVEDTYNCVNVFRLNSKKVSLVHVPSCCYPRDAASTVVETLSQGYIVEVYELGFILRGVDLATGEYMTDYEYMFTIDTNPEVSNNNMLLTVSDAYLSTCESVRVGVSLADSANKTVRISSSNNNVSVFPSELVFTTNNYADKQFVTITAASSVDNDSTALVYFDADGLTRKTVSITLNELPIKALSSGENTLVNNATYGGIYPNSRLTCSTPDTFEITFAGLDITYRMTAVYFSSDGIVGTVNLIGQNRLYSTESRGLSSSATTPIKLIGKGDNVTLDIIGDSLASAALKGDYELTNVAMSVTSGKTLLDIINSGTTIVDNGSYSVNNAKVELLSCEHGRLRVNVGAGTPGSSVITITSEPDEGYVLESLLVNGSENSEALAMPLPGDTITIQGVFIAN